MYKQKLTWQVATLHLSKKVTLWAFAALLIYAPTAVGQPSASPTNSIEMHRKLFAEYQKAGKAKELVAEAEALVRLSGNADWAVYDYAIALQSAGSATAAIEQYNRYLQKHPGDFNAELGRAQCLQATGKLREAVEALEKLSEQRPKDVDAMVNLASAYYDYHDDIAAETTANAALKAGAKGDAEVRAVRILANARLRHFDFSGALAAGKQLLELQPSQPDAYVFLVEQMMHVDKSPSTYAKLTDRAVKMVPPHQVEPFLTFGSLMNRQANSAIRARNLPAAVEFLRVARKNFEMVAAASEPAEANRATWLQAHTALATGAIQMNDYAYAVREANKVLSVDPGNNTARQIKEVSESVLRNDLARRMKDLVRGRSTI